MAKQKKIELNLNDVFEYLCELYGKEFVLKCNKKYFGTDTKAHKKFLESIGVNNG